MCRPRMGAWIEIWVYALPYPVGSVAPVWGRGLKSMSCLSRTQCYRRPRMGAWIEILCADFVIQQDHVAPVWGRGLKYSLCPGRYFGDLSPPYGGVD